MEASVSGDLGGNFLPFTHRIVEDSRKTLARPLNTAGIRGKWQNSALYSGAEPFQELFLVSFDHHWIAADPEQRDDGLLFLKLSIEPFRPLRHSRKSVNLGYRCPHKFGSRVRQDRTARAAGVVYQVLGDSDYVAKRLFPIGKLQRCPVRLCIATQRDMDRFETWAFDLEVLIHRNGGIDGCNLSISANHGNQVSLTASRRFGQDLADKAVQPQFKCRSSFVRALVVSQPTKAKVRVLHASCAFS